MKNMKDHVNKSEPSYFPLSGVIHERQRTLTSESFLGIGKVVEADKLELVVRIPGDEDQKLLLINWEKNAPNEAPQPVPFSSLKDSVIEKVLKTGSEIIRKGEHEYVNGEQNRRLEEDERAESVVAIPLVFQGAVTGCVCIRSQGQQGFSEPAIAEIRKFSQLAALVAQWERELDAAEGFSSAYIRWRVAQNVMRNSEAIEGIAEILLNVLSPAAVIIHLDVGFKSYIQIAGESGEADIIRQNLGEGLAALMKRLAASMEIVEADLLDVAEEIEKENILVGKLYVVVSKDKDTILTRGSSYSFRHIIATLTTDAVLNAVRDGLHSLNRELGLALNLEELASNSQWFDNVRRIAERARLLWAVATDLGGNEQYGDTDWRKVVQVCLERKESNPNTGNIIRLDGPTKRKEPTSRQIEIINLDDPTIGKHTVVSVYLPNTNARLWFGVEREEFGAELSNLSPWTVFLNRLAEIADSALLRLRMQHLQMEASETRTLATYVVTSHTVFHQIANMVNDIVNPISTIREALAVGALKANEDIVDLIKLSDQSAANLLDFASTFLNVNKMDTHRPCSLLEVINKSKEFFEFGLKSYQISLNVNVAEDLSIDVPFNVALLVIANLISNSKDSIGERGGNIWIEAENAGDMIHCYFVNDGPPVNPSVKDRIFHQIGVTTKQGQNVRGWGLYLAYRSLIENRGYIELTSTNAEETKFTIQFPRERQEEA